MYYVCNRSAAIYKGLVLCKTIPVDFHERISKSTRKKQNNGCLFNKQLLSLQDRNLLLFI